MSFLPAYFESAPPSPTRTRTVFLLHGIFGSGRNWRTFASDLADALPQLRLVVVDLRNHGSSLGALAPHTLAACADDLVRLALHLGVIPNVVIGHSFGGKVALAYARVATGLRTLISLDSPPGAGSDADRTPANTEAGRVLHVLRTLPMPVASRAEVAGQMTKLGVHAGVAKWMTTNLRPEATGGYAWHFDVDALGAMLDDYWAFDGWPMLEHPPRGLALHFVRAARSDRFTASDVARLDALAAQGKLEHHVLADAGHWLHVDNPRGLLELLVRLLR